VKEEKKEKSREHSGGNTSGKKPGASRSHEKKVAAKDKTATHLKRKGDWGENLGEKNRSLKA